MVYDTQEIIERAHHGDMDYIKHALTLFTDFVAVLVRILVIMVSTWLSLLLNLLIILRMHCRDSVWFGFWNADLTMNTHNVSVAAQERVWQVGGEEEEEEVLRASLPALHIRKNHRGYCLYVLWQSRTSTGFYGEYKFFFILLIRCESSQVCRRSSFANTSMLHDTDLSVMVVALIETWKHIFICD